MELKPKIEKGPLLGARHFQVLLCFTNKIVLSIARCHIAVTLVSMTDFDKSNPEFPVYKWTEQQKSFILCSNFLGTALTTIPGTYFLRKNGAKLNLFIITFCVGLFNGLIPLCIPRGGWRILCLLNFLQGISLACSNAMSMQHFASWAPPTERSRLGGLISIGIELGIIAAAFLSGSVPTSPLGWPGVFYITTLLCFMWCIFWFIFGANCAATAKFINNAERAYIETSLEKSMDFHKKSLSIPWCAIFTSIPFWALVVTRAMITFNVTILQTELPAYINGIFQENLNKYTIFTALPFIAAILMTFVFMAMSDFLMKREFLSLNGLRKFFNSISMWIPAVSLIWLGFLDMNQKTLAVVLMTASVGFTNAATYGSSLTRIELAPNHTSTIVSITDVISGVVRILAPLFVGAVVKEMHNQKQWQIVFNITAAVLGVGDLIFLIWGISEVQVWNDAQRHHRTSATFKNNEVINSKI